MSTHGTKTRGFPIRLGAVVAAMALVVTACAGAATTTAPASSTQPGSSSEAPAGGSSTPSGGSTAPTAVTMTTVRFSPDWNSSWPGWVPWVGAQAKGWFKDAGIDLQLVVPPDGDGSPKLVAGGQADIGMSIGGDLLVGASQGLNEVAVASAADGIPEGIGCWADKVKVPADIIGKTVAIYNFPSAQLYWGFFTKKWGLDTSKITVVDEGADGAPLMLANKADCVDVSPAGELVEVNTHSSNPTTFFEYDATNGIPQIQNSIIAANPSFLSSHPDVVKAFIGVWNKAMNYMLASSANSDEFAQDYVAAYPENDIASAKLGVAAMVKYAYARYFPSQPQGWISPQGWTDLAGILLNSKQIEAPIDNPAQYMSDDYLGK